MIIRKTITSILATLISITFISIVVFGEGVDLDTVVFTSIVFSPFILFYGVPVTFFSDYVTKRFTGFKRALFTMVIHLLFGIIFAPLFSLLGDSSSQEIKTTFIGATTVAFFFWAIDEILRRFL